MNRMYSYAVATLMALGMTAQQAHAALDASITTAITTAETDVKALLLALTTAGVAIFVVRVIARKFAVRA